MPRFVMLMKQMIESQKKAIEKAVIGMGEYHIAESHKHLCVDKQKFFQMNGAQRERHLKRLFEKHVPEKPSSTTTRAGQNPLLVLKSVPEYVLTQAWEGS